MKKMRASLVLFVILMLLTGCTKEGVADDGSEKTKQGADAEYLEEEDYGTGEEVLDGVMDAVQSRPDSSPEGTVQYLSVVANTEKIDDFEACAEEIIEHCVANDFKTVMFSYDLSGYPIEVHATVYLTRKDLTDGRPVFEMDYEQDKEGDVRYNIKDHPEKFHMTIKCSACGREF